MNHGNKVNCPKCNHEINVNELGVSTENKGYM